MKNVFRSKGKKNIRKNILSVQNVLKNSNMFVMIKNAILYWKILYKYIVNHVKRKDLKNGRLLKTQ